MGFSIVREEWGYQQGYEALAPTTATSFTSTLIKPTSGVCANLPCKAVLIAPESYPIRFRLDGTAPTATAGVQLSAGSWYVITGTSNIANFQCIDTAAGASSVKCLFFF